MRQDARGHACHESIRRWVDEAAEVAGCAEMAQPAGRHEPPAGAWRPSLLRSRVVPSRACTRSDSRRCRRANKARSRGRNQAASLHRTLIFPRRAPSPDPPPGGRPQGKGTRECSGPARQAPAAKPALQGDGADERSTVAQPVTWPGAYLGLRGYTIASRRRAHTISPSHRHFLPPMAECRQVSRSC